MLSSTLSQPAPQVRSSSAGSEAIYPLSNLPDACSSAARQLSCARGTMLAALPTAALPRAALCKLNTRPFRTAVSRLKDSSHLYYLRASESTPSRPRRARCARCARCAGCARCKMIKKIPDLLREICFLFFCFQKVLKITRFSPSMHHFFGK